MSRLFDIVAMLTCSSVKVATTNVLVEFDMSRFLAIADVNVGHWPYVKVAYEKIDIILQ